MSVIAGPDAVAFITERGGCLYVWAGAGRLKRVATKPPPDLSMHFDRVEAPGFAFFVSADVKSPSIWTVKLRRFPRRHLDVLWDGEQPSMGPPVFGAGP